MTAMLVMTAMLKPLMTAMLVMTAMFKPSNDRYACNDCYAYAQ